MSYATKDEIKSMFRDFADDADAAVSPTDLDLFLENSKEIIDSRISTLYKLPITLVDNPKSFKILKQVQMYKVACMVDDILNNYGEADKKPSWCKMSEMMMKELVPSKKDGKQVEPVMKLPDAEYLGTTRQSSRIKIAATSGRQIIKGGNNW